MRNLILFFIKFSPYILLILYLTVGTLLLFEKNPYQNHIFLTSANSISSSIYSISSNIKGYFNLKNINEDLLRKNSELELEVINLNNKLLSLEDSISFNDILEDGRYSFTIGHVINNSTIHPRNYITIDKGYENGIEKDMGVFDHNGIVGIIDVVGPHSSRAISLLNDQFRLSSKVKGQNFVGSLIWDGKKPSEAILEEIPRHSSFNKGDTIVTSGFSSVFPEGIPVGIIIDELSNYDENFYALRIELFTDFENLSAIKIVKDKMKDEIKKVEAGN